MKEELCRFSLILPGWLPWVLLPLGSLLFGLAVYQIFTRASGGTIDWKTVIKIDNIYPVLLLLLGLIFFAAGVAPTYPPLAGVVGEWIPKLIYEADARVSADLNEKQLGDMAPSSNGLYIVRISPAASKVKVSGVYRDARCDADLFNQICRHESQTLSCDIDAGSKILRICTKADNGLCQDRTL